MDKKTFEYCCKNIGFLQDEDDNDIFYHPHETNMGTWITEDGHMAISYRNEETVYTEAHMDRIEAMFKLFKK